MANGNERNRDDERDKDVIGGKDESVQPEAIPGSDREQGTAYDSSTGGGAAGEIEDPSDTPSQSQRGRDLDH